MFTVSKWKTLCAARDIKTGDIERAIRQSDNDAQIIVDFNLQEDTEFVEAIATMRKIMTLMPF